MLSYIVAGLVTGGIYAISSTALVITYNASRVFNFGQGAMAFFIAYCFHWLHAEQGLNPWVAGGIAVFLIGPALGIFLWAVLLGKLGTTPFLVRVAGTIGLQVALTGATFLIFGDDPVFQPSGLISHPHNLFKLFGVSLSNEQLLIFGSAIAVALLGAFVLYGTTAGLITRGAVDSRLMTLTTGTNPNLVAAGTWAVGSALAGLAGVLIVPKVGLDGAGFASLIVASFAGVVIGKLTNLWLAFGGAMAVGVAQAVVIPYLPKNGIWATATRPSMPFLFMVIAILVYSRTNAELRGETQIREVAAVQSKVERRDAHMADLMRGRAGRWDRYIGWVLLVAIVPLTPLILNDFWMGVVALGVTYSVIFLSFRLVTGEAGVISLCQVSFAGIGAIAAAQLATVHHWPVLVAIVVAAVIAGVAGVVVGLVCLPLGQLYAAIATFAFALLTDEAIYKYEKFSNFDSGINLSRPRLGTYRFDSNTKFYFLAVAAFALVALLLWNLRRSTSGMVFATMRASRSRAETLGFPIFSARMAVFVAGAMVAGLGGGLNASYQLVAFPGGYVAVLGLVWFAVAIAQGPSSMGGAAVAGLSLALFPQIVAKWLPDLGDVPPILFGLAAIGLAANPNGINTNLRSQMRQLAAAIDRRRLGHRPPDQPTGAPVVAVEDGI